MNAGLTELESQTNGIEAAAAEPSAVPATSAGDEGGNLAGDNWQAGVGGVENNGLDGSYEVIPRDPAEVDIPASAAPATQGKIGSWADDAAQEAAGGSSNKAGEKWDIQAPGEEAQGRSSAGTPATNTSVPAAAADDGFQEIPSKHAGRGRGRGRGGDGEFRGRGRGRGGHRGDGEGRGRGGGGRGGYRGGRGDGEGGRGRGGRGRGPPRGGAVVPT